MCGCAEMVGVDSELLEVMVQKLGDVLCTITLIFISVYL